MCAVCSTYPEKNGAITTDRKGSLDSTQASDSSGSSDKTDADFSAQPSLEDVQCKSSTAQIITRSTSCNLDSKHFCGGLGLDVACMSSDPLKRPRIAIGTSIRVWRRTSSTTRMEWAEVLRLTAGMDGMGNRRVLCETLLFELFEFSPELVARGCDDAVHSYEITHEDSQKARLRREEVARLHSALSEHGRLTNLPPAREYHALGHIVAPSQFHVKATIISHAAKRRALQDSVQQQMLLSLAARSFEKHTNNKDAASQKRTQFRPHASADMISAKSSTCPRHIPELCPECIRLGNWCCGSLHLPGATMCIDAAVGAIHSHVRWAPCEAGLEAEVEHEGARLLLQIRPRLFCIPYTDARLFGRQSSRYPPESSC